MGDGTDPRHERNVALTVDGDQHDRRERDGAN
jgi:hypothetical protein